jgi:hypothetical protein
VARRHGRRLARPRERRIERLGVADVDQLVALEVGVQRQVGAREAGANGARPAGDGRRIGDAVAHHLDCAAALGHENRVVRHERHAPWVAEAAGVDADADGLSLRGFVADRRFGQRWNLDALRRHRRGAAHRHFLLGSQRHGEEGEPDSGEAAEESVHVSISTVLHRSS